MDRDRWQQRWERKMERRRNRQSKTFAPFAGLAIIGIGALFLLQNLGIIYVRDVWQYWPVILIAFGLSRIAENEFNGGIVLLAIGSVFLATNLGFLSGNAWRYMWPVLLIGAGVTLLLRGMGVGCQPRAPNAFTNWSSPSATVEASAENRLNIHLAFSTTERRISTQEFEGGEIHVAFGAAELDLRNAQTKRPEIFLNVHAAFGGVELIVPDTWVVVLRGSGAFGVFEDKTHPVNPVDPTKPRLILTGSAAFGGVTVKN